MHRIINNRGTGKTKELMLFAKENDSYFVCSNPRAMQEKAYVYGITGLRFISYSEFFSNRREMSYGTYVIDELEEFIKCLAPNGNFIGYTVSEDE